jgi:hypothetical protein
MENNSLYNAPDVVFPEQTPHGLKDAIMRFESAIRELKDSLEREENASGIEFCDEPFNLAIFVSITLGATIDGEQKLVDGRFVHAKTPMLKHALRSVARECSIPAIIL